MSAPARRSRSTPRAVLVAVTTGALAWLPGTAAAQLVINGNYNNATALNAGTGQPQTTITVNNSQFTQAVGASLNALAGGTVTLNNVNVIGGLLSQAGTGVLTANGSGSNFLTGITLAGTFDLASNTGAERVVNGLTFGSGGGSGGFNVNSNSILAFDGTQTLSGTGSIVFGATGSGNRITIEGASTLTIGPNVSISGQNGTIGNQVYVGGAAAIANNGTITANVANGTITITQATVTNGGTLGAANGGLLDLNSAVTNTAAGQLSATANGVVRINNTSVSGGTVVTSTGGVLTATNSGNNFLTGSTLNGTLDLATNTSSVRVGSGLTLVSGSTVNINSNSVFALEGTQTIGGTGTIVFGTTGSGNRITLEGSGGTTTIGSNVTIRGQNGRIGDQVYVGGAAALTNNGTITADVAGGTIEIINAPVTNNGTLGAANGGTLLLSSNVAGNSGSQISAGAGSVVRQNGVVVSGAVNTAGSGSFVATNNGNNYLSGVTLNGAIDLASATGSERVINGLTFQSGSTISVDNNSVLALQGTQTIGGTGTIILGTTGSGNRITIEGDGIAATIGPNVTIRGQNGTIGSQVYIGGNTSLVNNGTITADVAGGTITIEHAPVTNNGVLGAANGGTLVLSSNVTGNSGSQLSAGAGSLILQNGVTVSGQINTTGTGSFRPTNNGNNYLNGATLNGAIDLASATGSERIINGFTFQSGSTISVDNNSVLALQGTQTIGGTGTIVLGATGAGNNITIEGDGITATIGPNVTIRGQNGTIGNQVYIGGNTSLVNNGTIAADVAGGTIAINHAPVTNNATLAALNGGTLVLNSNVAGGAASQIATDAASYVLQNGVTLSGRMNVTGGGSIRATNNGSNFLDGVTLRGTLDLATATASERVVNGLTFGVGGGTTGRINVDNNSVLAFQGTQTLGGTGEIVLGSTLGAYGVVLDGDGATLTVGPNVTIHGTNGGIGYAYFVGGANRSIINNGTIASDGGGTIDLNVNTVGGAGGHFTTTAGSALRQNGVTLSGQLNVSGAGSFRATNNSSNFLDGATLNGTLDLASAAGSERVVNGLTLGAGGSTTGRINVNSGSVLAFQGTQTLGGTGEVVLGNAGGPYAIVLDGEGATLTVGQNVTIRGENGSIGSVYYVGGGNRSIVNNGTISSDGGGTIDLNVNTVGSATGRFTTTAGSVLRQNGVTLSGQLNVSGDGSFRAANNGGNFLDGATLNGTLDLAGAAGSERVINGLTLGAGGGTTGRINVNSGSVLAFQGTQTLGGTGEIVFGNAGGPYGIVLDGNGAALTVGPNVTIHGQNGTIGNAYYVGGGSRSIINTGTIASDAGGTITVTSTPITNNGLLRAQNGTLTIDTPLDGTGTLQVDAAGTANLNGGTGVAQGTLTIGGPGATVNNGTRNITLSTDYTNASAGSGDSFNRRAGITGTGQVLAGGDVAQAIGGAQITNGATPNATLTIGNVRVGSTTYTYTIDNTGSTGPALRGALQTGANGGNITDSRLSGSGVTAGLYGPAPVGGSSGPYEVTFTTNSTGALAPLAGQTVNLRSSYENIDDQKLNVVVASGAGAYKAAQGQLNTPALDFGTVQVGQVVTQNLSFTNVATGAAGYVEDLDVSFGAPSGAGGARISGSGAINGLVAGATASGMTVTVNTATGGTVNGAIAINYTSAGAVNGVSNGLGTLAVGGTSYGVTGTITATVVEQAMPVINNAPINLGNVRINSTAVAALSVTNQSTGNTQAALNASVTGAGPVSASGSFSLLEPGSTNSSALTVGINTATAGAVSGTATVAFVSDASNVGNCGANCQLALPSQNVTVSGNVYRLANPTVGPTSATFAARVGGAAPTQTITVTNSSPDQYTEALNASFSGAAPTGFTTTGSVNGLAAGASSTALKVGLSTATAGTFSGTATINEVSSGAGTTGAPDLAVGSTNVSLAGKIYTAAVGQVAPNPLSFGIVHVGDVATRTIAVTNAAPVTALNDVLTGSASGGNAAFSVSGNLGAGVAAGATDNTSIQVALNTTTNGFYTGTAAVALASHDADLADLALGTTNVGLSAQVNNYAQGAFVRTGGAGAFSMTGVNAYLLDFGTITMGTGASTASLGVDNVATGYADLLNGSFLTSGTGFSFFGFGSFTDIFAGGRFGGLQISLDASMAGLFSGLVTLTDYGTNASGYNGALDPITLELRGNVVAVVNPPTTATPEPGTWALLATGLAGLGAVARRRRRTVTH